jgi:hypothetical protein
MVVDSSTFYAAVDVFLPPSTISLVRITGINSSGGGILRLYDEFGSDRLMGLISGRTTTGPIQIYATIATNKTRPVFVAGPHVFFWNSGSTGESVSFDLELLPGIAFRRFE